MPLRQLRDESGREWTVWDTHPSKGDVRAEYAAGWLTFRYHDDTRRVAPAPEQWFAMPDEALMALLAGAKRAGERRTGL